MEFTRQDSEALYQVWMSQKSKMRLTQMEFAKKLGMSQLEFSGLLRGDKPLSMAFVSQFCRLLNLDSRTIVPTLQERAKAATQQVYLESRMTVDGEIKRAYIEGNQVVVEYMHTVPA
ncbi:helix-turn-helix domain-containing protein [Vibrio intestinalis]|uniref:helix-turn-helix domain-containing protein n=1 Tax=Vibrio intestinalis TaxID=2933291 RepID=UPI0021A4F28F|nr:helix-turn-helix transcriptional regulator [Vibrio intestinalis]